MLLPVHCSDGCLMMDIHVPAESQKFSEMKFVPALDIIFVKSLYSANIILHILFRLSAMTLSVCFTTRNLLW